MTTTQGARPYDVYAKLEDPMGVLSVALGQWEDRDDTRPQPEVRRAANTAMDAIDGMLARAHAMRSRLMGEIPPRRRHRRPGGRAAVAFRHGVTRRPGPRATDTRVSSPRPIPESAF